MHFAAIRAAMLNAMPSSCHAALSRMFDCLLLTPLLSPCLMPLIIFAYLPLAAAAMLMFRHDYAAYALPLHYFAAMMPC